MLKKLALALIPATALVAGVAASSSSSAEAVPVSNVKTTAKAGESDQLARRWGRRGGFRRYRGFRRFRQFRHFRRYRHVRRIHHFRRGFRYYRFGRRPWWIWS